MMPKTQNNFLWVCWFLCKNLSNFVPPAWKLHNPYCHNDKSSNHFNFIFTIIFWEINIHHFIWKKDFKVIRNHIKNHFREKNMSFWYDYLPFQWVSFLIEFRSEFLKRIIIHYQLTFIIWLCNINSDWYKNVFTDF